MSAPFFLRDKYDTARVNKILEERTRLFLRLSWNGLARLGCIGAPVHRRSAALLAALFDNR